MKENAPVTKLIYPFCSSFCSHVHVLDWLEVLRFVIRQTLKSLSGTAGSLGAFLGY